MPNDDDKIWEHYTKGVKRTRSPVRKAVEPVFSLKKPDSTLVHSSKSALKAPPITLPKKENFSKTAFDRKTEKELRQGEIRLEARLDLHGMIQTEAHTALAAFIASQVKAGRRNLLVITGKGKGKEGVLRNNLSGWLEALPAAGQILALRPAAPKHGGDGAFYVLLRRQKD